MVNIYVGLMIITATTVGKIMLCSVAGTFVSRYFSNPETSQKGLSYIAMKVFLPCLLFANLCLNVTWDQLREFYWAPLFAFLPMTLGFLSSVLVSVLLTKEYRFVVILASTFQNGLTFPVSVLLNLKGVDWFTGAAVVNAQSYIFLYNVVCSMGLWAIGDPLIGYAKAKEVEEEEESRAESEMAARRQRYVDMGLDGEAAAYENRSFSYPFESPRHDGSAAPTRKHSVSASATREEAEAQEQRENAEGDSDEKLPEPVSPRTAAALQKRAATVREQLGWYRPAQAKDRPIVPPAASPVIMLDGEMGIEDVKAVKGKDERWKRLGHIALKSIQSPPVLSSVVAIVISLTPPLRWLAMSPLGEPFVGGMSLIGEGAIPLQLLVLGSSIAASRPKDDPASPSKAGAPGPFPTASAGTAAPAEADASGTPTAKDGNALVRYITSKVSPQVIFTWCTVVTRLIIIPAICFLVLHILVKIGLMPNDKPFLLSMLVAIMSPSAMNSTLICAMHGYHARDYARMIFCMYVSTIFTATVWLFFFILYQRD